MTETYTIKDYLQGKVRDFNIPDEALLAICNDAGIIGIDMPFSELSEMQKDLSVAYAYLWLANGPVSTAKWSEADGDWSQSGGGQQLTATQIRTYIRYADAIFRKYGLDTIGQNNWGMRVGGFRNIRNYNGTQRTR